MTGLEILDQLLLGQTAYHRRPDAWDLLDKNGLVIAVLCPRKAFVAFSPVPKRAAPARPDGSFVPYGEKVALRITADNIEDGIDKIHELKALHAD
jgi:hypothetical protein